MIFFTILWILYRPKCISYQR